MLSEKEHRISDYLRTFVTEERLRLFQNVLEQRTRYLTVVLENIYQPQNASAVLRSCDGFGIQDVHIIENFNDFAVSSGVTKGVDKWMTLEHYNKSDFNTVECLNHLKGQGYAIAATSPHAEGYELHNMPLDKPVAIMFGAEKKGLTDTALEMADMHVRIPMVGFSESFNISVSAAVTLYDLAQRLKEQFPASRKLSQNEQDVLLLKWLRKSLENPELIEERFTKENGL
jgi:tRNA (guanosine-2'-O-)-methyltransferase